MSGRTHAIVPAGLSALLFNSDPAAVLLAVLGGLAPDIDEPYSVIGQRLWFVAWWMKYVCGHRTISHSFFIVALIGIAGLLVLIPPKLVMAFCLGWTTHILLDAMSGGVQLCWPSTRRWVLGRYPVYGGMDRILLVGGLLVFLVCMWARIERDVGHPSGIGTQWMGYKV